MKFPFFIQCYKCHLLTLPFWGGRWPSTWFPYFLVSMTLYFVFPHVLHMLKDLVYLIKCLIWLNFVSSFFFFKDKSFYCQFSLLSLWQPPSADVIPAKKKKLKRLLLLLNFQDGWQMPFENMEDDLAWILVYYRSEGGVFQRLLSLQQWKL